MYANKKKRAQLSAKTETGCQPDSVYAAMEQAAKRRQALDKLFQMYDKNQTGKLGLNEAKKLLSDMDTTTPVGTDPTKSEFGYVMKVADMDQDRMLAPNELVHAVKAWNEYIKVKSKMKEALAKFDTNKTGALEKAELKEYLTSLNNGKKVT